MTKETLKLVGVDEAGRGPLAGPVVAGAVYLKHELPGLADSKTISARKREQLFQEITQHHIWSYAVVTSTEIDRLNILNASLLAFTRAVDALQIEPDMVLVDGTHLPNWQYQSQAIIKGDQKVAAISAASIVAKVIRDRMMSFLDQQCPVYQFAKHKGYPTKQHMQLLKEHGPCYAHRLTFAPVKRLVV